MGAAARGVGATNWPSIGEFDIMEDVNALSEVSHTFHCGVDPGGPCNETNGISSNLLACGAPGANYNISVPTVYASNHGARYIPTLTLPKTQCTTGTAMLHQTFATQYYVSVQSTPGGSATATVGSTTTNTGFWVASGTTVGLTAYVQPGYDFLGWNGSGPGNYSGSLQIDTIVIAGPVLEVAAFALPQTKAPTTYWLEFTLSAPLSAGTAWTVTVGNTGYTSTGSSLTIPDLVPQSYTLSYSTAYSPDGQTKYTAVGDPTSVSLSTNKTLTIGFSASYWLSVTAGVGGTIVSPLTASGWVAKAMRNPAALPTRASPPCEEPGASFSGLVRQASRKIRCTPLPCSCAFRTSSKCTVCW